MDIDLLYKCNKSTSLNNGAICLSSLIKKDARLVVENKLFDSLEK